ncbi:MAG: FMN-binding protein [Candidatus Cloacimonadaceae bacterium]|jgi:Na+-translocating ferredoxin:NAD+ oxidoreductase RnfG subunit|nr:FMN-binding protein [Candidatus Cloacimonadota bacterium]MDY0126907.1 FMN-binding protein [Candidatus Cloacimonadaceae bacterium]MCB5255301.1 FMN-binding protein [Candidatus Cloacimonadota bacterium]MCK9178736.1 FMN-binding protein [Candidatus Cloacimonadota bacterium]MCK9242423.1 FMN-binding protein [Candidatus Cloacimonadota bacterium]
MKKLSLIAILITSIVGIYCLPDLQRYPNAKFEQITKEYTQADSIDFLYTKNYRIARLHYEDSIQYFALSTDYAVIKGYSGITTLGIIFDSAYEVAKVSIIASEDTRSFVNKLKTRRFLDQFIGYKKNDKMKIVTGATISSKAVIKSVEMTAAKVLPILELL